MTYYSKVVKGDPLMSQIQRWGGVGTYLRSLGTLVSHGTVSFNSKAHNKLLYNTIHMIFPLVVVSPSHFAYTYPESKSIKQNIPEKILHKL